MKRQATDQWKRIPTGSKLIGIVYVARRGFSLMKSDWLVAPNLLWFLVVLRGHVTDGKTQLLPSVIFH